MADPFGPPPTYDTCSAEGITLTATVRGAYRGKVVSVDFNQGGCEKYRWAEYIDVLIEPGRGLPAPIELPPTPGGSAQPFR